MELTLFSYVDLGIQIILGIVLLLDYSFLRKKSVKLHSTLMTTAFLVNTILLLTIMIPPFVDQSAEIFENLTELESLLFLSHHLVGLVAEVLAGIVVVRFVVNALKQLSCKSKNIMRATITLWLFSIILGVILFLWHFME